MPAFGQAPSPLSVSFARLPAPAPPAPPAPPEPTPDPPVAITPARVTGKAGVGERVTCNTGTWAGAPTFSYAWRRNGKVIKDEQQRRYTVRKADRRQKLTCTV